MAKVGNDILNEYWIEEMYPLIRLNLFRAILLQGIMFFALILIDYY